MNYDRRFSPQMAHNDFGNRTMNYRDSRSQQITPRGNDRISTGIDLRSPYYGREYPPLRSRSQNNVDQDNGDRFSQPQPPFYDNRALDRSSRSKSLDAREFRGDDGYYRDPPPPQHQYPQDGIPIPIRREGPGVGQQRGPFEPRSSPQQARPREIEQYPPYDDRRGPGPEVHIPYNNRDQGYGPRRSIDGRNGAAPFRDGDSPKSYSSRFKDNRRAIEYNNERDGFDDFERGREDFGAVQPYRSGGGGAGGGGGYRSSSYHRSHHHESHGGGGGHEMQYSSGGAANTGRAITHQPQMYHNDPRPVRPIQHHRVQCCCFKLVWPPWSYEQAPPPQPIYRNI